MADSWFSLSREDQVEALEFAAARTGRPAHLLEKDIWVVWVLSAIYESNLAGKLTFKGAPRCPRSIASSIGFLRTWISPTTSANLPPTF